MTPRDRLVVLVIAIAGIVAAAYFLVVSPARDKADKAAVALSDAQTSRDAALAQAAAAIRSRSSFPRNVVALNLLNKAVPPNDDVAALLRQLEATAKRDRIDFRSLKSAQQSTVTTTPAPTAPPVAGAPPTAPTLPSSSYTLVFAGNFLALERFVGDVLGYAQVSNTDIRVTGRLVSMLSVKLTPSQDVPGKMDATITANDYTLPPGQTPAQVVAALGSSGGPAAAARAAVAKANASAGVSVNTATGVGTSSP